MWLIYVNFQLQLDMMPIILSFHSTVIKMLIQLYVSALMAELVAAGSVVVSDILPASCK